MCTKKWNKKYVHVLVHHTLNAYKVNFAFNIYRYQTCRLSISHQCSYIPKTESARELQSTKATRLLLLHGVEDSAGELLGGGVAAHVAGPV